MPAKKKTKKITKKKSVSSAKSKISPISFSQANPPKFTRKQLNTVLILIAVALLTYKVGPWMFPVVINNRPLSRFTLINRLESAYGAQVLDDLINEKILDLAVKNAGVSVDQSTIDTQTTALEEQFAELGGLDAALSERGVSRQELEQQIFTQLAVEEILADKITPTDEEVSAEYTANAETAYAGKTLEEVQDIIIENIKQAKLRDAFLEWFAEVKQEYQVKNFGL